MAVQSYRIFGRPMAADEEGFLVAVERAHTEHHRPRCLCGEAEPEMYIARWRETYLLKRMPFTGSSHSQACTSHDLSIVPGRGDVTKFGQESSGVQMTIWPAFAMSKRDVHDSGGHKTRAAKAKDRRPRLSLLGLLHHLWERAELTRWHPGFAGRRSWAVVRKRLMGAAAGEVLAGEALRNRLFAPKTFQVQRREANIERLRAHWELTAQSRPGEHPLMLVVGELKEIRYVGGGPKARIKHLPQQPFLLSERLYSDLCRRFDRELSDWSSAQDERMVTIATFGLDGEWSAHLNEISIMTTTADWIPVADGLERQLIAQLVWSRRHFRKRLADNGSQGFALVDLLDLEGSPVPTFIAGMAGHQSSHGQVHAAQSTRLRLSTGNDESIP